MLSYGSNRVSSAEAHLGQAWLGPYHLCVCRPAELGGAWSDAELTDQPSPTRAASLGQLSNEELQLTKGSAWAAFAAELQCWAGIEVAESGWRG